MEFEPRSVLAWGAVDAKSVFERLGFFLVLSFLDRTDLSTNVVGIKDSETLKGKQQNKDSYWIVRLRVGPKF